MSAPFPADQLGADGLIPDALVAQRRTQYQILRWTGLCTLYGTNRVVAAAQRKFARRLAVWPAALYFLVRRVQRSLRHSPISCLVRSVTKLGGIGRHACKNCLVVAGRPNETALPLAYWRNPKPPTGPNLDPARDGCGLI